MAALAVVGLMASAPGAAASAPAFTQVSGSPFSTGAGTTPLAVAFSPSGLLATANSYGLDRAFAGTVSLFSTSAGGTVTPVGGSPFATGAEGTVSVAFNPDGTLLAASSVYSPPPYYDAASRVSVLTVGAGGALTPVDGSPFVTGNGPLSVAFSPGGGLLATADYNLSKVSVFSVASDGELTQVSGSPFATGFAPTQLAFSPNGLLLATSDGGGTVSVFSVGSGGQLTPVTGSPFAAGYGPNSLAFDSSGRLLAVGNSDGTVSLFSVGSGGGLTQVKGSPFSSGTGSNFVTFSPAGLLAVVNQGTAGDPPAYDDTVSIYSVTSRGAVSPVSGSPFPRGTDPAVPAFSAGGRLLAIPNADDSTVTVYRASGQGGNSQGQNNNNN